MMSAVYELSTVRPHEPEHAKFSHAEFLVYRAGYEYALLVVLKLLKMTVEHWYANRRAARKSAVAKKRA